MIGVFAATSSATIEAALPAEHLHLAVVLDHYTVQLDHLKCPAAAAALRAGALAIRDARAAAGSGTVRPYPSPRRPVSG